MDREIKFRGKRVDNGEWVNFNCYGIYLDLHGNEIEPKRIIRDCGYEIVAETVGQYTGLKDVNLKDVCEGDIVIFGQHKYQITLEYGGFCLYDKDGNVIEKIGGINDHCYSLFNLHLECCWEETYAYDIEIIGNVYDNPELMEVEE